MIIIQFFIEGCKKSILERHVTSLEGLYNSFTTETLDEILYSPIWYNTLINIEFNFCYNDWYNKQIRNINDLINEEGRFYTFNELKSK